MAHAPGNSPAPTSRYLVPGVILVASAAALWGTDGIFRFWLALEMPAAVLVFLEHAVLTVLVIPFLVKVGPALRRLDRWDWVSLILVGAGASVLATTLFTAAFAAGDPTTPLLLQKLQPAFAVLGAALLLGERLATRYWAYFVAGVAGAFLISFPDPTAVTVTQATPALLAVGAAGLWGMGTVLGRRLTAKVPFSQLTALRFSIGLPVSAAVVAWQGGWDRVVGVTGNEIVGVIGLALVPGLFALLVYYRGLGRTPAAAATIAELAFPLSALFLNWIVLDATLNGTQLVGAAVLAATITTMGLAQANARLGVRTEQRQAVATG